MFAAFSPTVNAEVVVAVISENDTVGGRLGCTHRTKNPESLLGP